MAPRLLVWLLLLAAGWLLRLVGRSIVVFPSTVVLDGFLVGDARYYSRAKTKKNRGAKKESLSAYSCIIFWFVRLVF